MMFKEIERKFLVKTPPKDLKINPSVKITQYYLPPITFTLRLRKISSPSGRNNYYLTLKYGKGLSRTEIEPRIPFYIFSVLVKLFAISKISKTRYKIPYNMYTIELDDYDDHNLLTAEVEFTNLEDCNSFVPPAWFSKDISNNQKYKNRHLATKI